LISFNFDIEKIDNIRVRLFSAMKRRRFSTKKTGSSSVSRSFLDVPDKDTKLKRRHATDRPHGLWRSGHCSQSRVIEQIYIWKLIVPSMTKEPGKKYRGK
jgi:hypothetical protein